VQRAGARGPVQANHTNIMGHEEKLTHKIQNGNYYTNVIRAH
jgi:hypothetical protein